MIRVALRSHRWAALGVALIGFVATYAQGAAFKTAAGTTLAERAAFGKQITALGPQLAYLIPLPLHPETVAGRPRRRRPAARGERARRGGARAAAGGGPPRRRPPPPP